MDHSNLLESLISTFNEHGIRFCAIGGQAVNAYVEPLVSLDLIERRAYSSPESLLCLREQGHQLFIKLAAFRKSLR